MQERDKFVLKSKYQPTGDQPEAIKELTEGVLYGIRTQVLVGDMEDITRHMDENQHIAADLKRETEVFKKL